MVRRSIPARPSKAERRFLRAGVGSLQDSVVAPATLNRYSAACSWMFWLVRVLNLDLPVSGHHMDQLMVTCIECAWSEGEARALVGDLLSGLSHFIPSLRGMLAGSWRLHAAWGRLEMPARAWPLNEDQLYAMCCVACQWNFMDVVVVLLLGYHCFLRTGEFVSATVGQISFATCGRRAFLALPFTKTQARKGAPEGAAITAPALVALLRWFVKHGQPGDNLLQRTGPQFRSLWAHLVAAVGLDGFFRPYSIRRGGATHFFRTTNSLDKTCDRGRWNSIATCRIYVNTALVDAIAQQQSGDLMRSIEARAAHFRAALANLLLASEGWRGEHTFV